MVCLPLLLAAWLSAPGHAAPSLTIDHLNRDAAASGCADGCGRPAATEFNAIDGLRDTHWSSPRHPRPDAPEWFAFWFQNGARDAFPSTSYLRIHPRTQGDASGFVPEAVTIDYATAEGDWRFLTTAALPADIPASGHRIDFEPVRAAGFRLTATRLRGAPWDPEGFSFQLAEVSAGTSDCAQWASDPDMASWCAGNPAYFTHEADDTVFRGNDKVRFGVNASYGGAIFLLFGKDLSPDWAGRDWMHRPWKPNALHRNGGSAVQIDLYGPGVGGVTRCPGIPAMPFHRLWNAIMAQAYGCTWNTATNDVDRIEVGRDRVQVSKRDPGQFSQREPWSDLNWTATATARDGYLELAYDVRYEGRRRFAAHPQNVPVVFTDQGMNHHFTFYTGGSACTGGPVTTTGPFADAKSKFVALPGHHRRPIHWGRGEQVVGRLTEPWVTVCDATGKRCLTLATTAPEIREIQLTRGDLGSDPARHGALAFVAEFAVRPRLQKTFAGIYLFPYRFDEVISGTATVRDVICSLR